MTTKQNSKLEATEYPPYTPIYIRPVQEPIFSFSLLGYCSEMIGRRGKEGNPEWAI